MDIKLTKIADDKSKATIYTLTKTDDNKKSALIKVIDYGNNGLDNTDGIVVRGNTSVFTNDEIKNKLLNGYQNTTATTKLPAVEYTESNGNLDINAGKEFSLGSFAKTVGVNPATTGSTTSATAQSFTTPSFNMPDFSAAANNAQYIDTSMFDGMGAGSTIAPQAGNFNYAKAQEAMNSYSGIGALMGLLSTLGGDTDFMTSALLPMMGLSMLHDPGNLYSAPVAATNTTNTTVENTAPAVTTSTPAAVTTSSTPAPTAATPATSTTSQHTKTQTQHRATTVVEDTEKEYQELAKAPKTTAKKETVKHSDGTVSTTNQNGNKVIQKFKSGTLVEETEYYGDGSFSKTQHSEIKGAVYQKGETVGVNKDGLQIRKYTNTEDGSRIVESRRNGKLVQTDIYEEDGSSTTTLVGKAPVRTSTSPFRYVDNQHLASYVQCLDNEHLKNFFFGK